MSVITIVQRALPFSLPWKRRHSTTKEKESDSESPDLAFHEDELFGNQFTDSPGTTLHYDVSDAVHIAVKQPLDDTTNPDASGPESNSDSDSEHETHQFSDNSQARAREQLCRAVSWASIVRSQCRWSREQERQLWIAEKELRRCQKAWSSEQEVWLAYIQSLNEEKEAHEYFVLMRMKQQEEERNQFRKSWKRRRSVESAPEEKEYTPPIRRNSSGLNRFRPLPLYGKVVPDLARAESTAVACRA
ncbi:hypothetical protein N7448_006734 [Penicillium atrosanguineum]|uniref:Uncharacterized protein n=1 Tax=Penicillium atrosanguineum TaxID=1132637 RepID=A0A9W9L2R4_9EURO|nr:uncharacterized protein N7443_010495 [Penicillium atrosanguineum]KAJ5132576.1 hypothetical protein N7448_006734 [Penicillium atrosanguineum]KAJ5141540.1 hypothetical protein N7526_002535 [Penicillium atrosanguineum]KAJ5290242.1 hypothetical protein N7443_010495 [Penicillium atrosanguineum]KAJ5308066.1 hypothetical protein N7476_008722 [Penicillium atrosanguineum]